MKRLDCWIEEKGLFTITAENLVRSLANFHSCVCPVIDNEFHHDIVKVVCGSTRRHSFFDNVMKKFMIDNNRIIKAYKLTLVCFNWERWKIIGLAGLTKRKGEKKEIREVLSPSPKRRQSKMVCTRSLYQANIGKPKFSRVNKRTSSSAFPDQAVVFFFARWPHG